jgi:hypothetical protein
VDNKSIVGMNRNKAMRARMDYIEALASIMGAGETGTVGSSLEDRNVQAAVARVENRVALFGLLLKAWYPYRYRVIAIEELNAVAAGHDPNAWSIDGTVEGSEYFVIDISRIDTARARSGFGKYDDMALVRFIEANMEYVGYKVLVVLDRRLQVVQRAFPMFCELTREHGIEVFDKGKYRRLGGRT